MSRYIVNRTRKEKVIRYGRSRTDKSGKLCAYCGKAMQVVYGTQYRPDEHPRFPTVDHIVPRARGGSNRVDCCRECNGLKGGSMPWQWIAYLRENMPERVAAVEALFQSRKISYSVPRLEA